jgi:hypothetical protein
MQFDTLSSRERFHEILRSIIVDRKKLSELTKDEFSTLLLDSFWDSCIRRVLYGEMKWDIGTYFKDGYYLDGDFGIRNTASRDNISDLEHSDPILEDDPEDPEREESESESESPIQNDLVRIMR